MLFIFSWDEFNKLNRGNKGCKQLIDQTLKYNFIAISIDMGSATGIVWNCRDKGNIWTVKLPNKAAIAISFAGTATKSATATKWEVTR